MTTIVPNKGNSILYKDFRVIDYAIQRLSSANLKMLRVDYEFLFEKDREFFENEFLEGNFDISEYCVDETLNEIQETALSAHGLAYFIIAVIRSSYRNATFSSFSTDRILSSLSSRIDPTVRYVDPFAEGWAKLTKMELLEILEWVNWLVFGNMSWPIEERLQYLHQMDLCLPAMRVLIDMIEERGDGENPDMSVLDVCVKKTPG